MSTLITGNRLKTIVEKHIEHVKLSNVEGIKYDFCLSDRFLKTKHQAPANISDFTIATKENFTIDPGETVFVLSEEILRLPKNIKAELSHKRKIAHLGILVLGGFCIDPLYEGHLIFGMYNYSNRPFQLQKDKKLIAAQFYELSAEEIGEFPKPKSLMDFPDELVQIAKGLSPISLQGIENRIEQVSNRLLEIENSIKNRKEWFDKIGREIDRIIALTGDLGSALNGEREARKLGQDSLQNLVAEEQKVIKGLASAVTTERLVRKIAVWLIAIIMAATLSFYLVRIGMRKDGSLGSTPQPPTVQEQTESPK